MRLSELQKAGRAPGLPLSIELADAAGPAQLQLLRNRGVGHGAYAPLPDALFERLNVTREKAEDAVNKVLEAEVLLRELANKFSQA